MLEVEQRDQRAGAVAAVGGVVIVAGAPAAGVEGGVEPVVFGGAAGVPWLLAGPAGVAAAGAGAAGLGGGVEPVVVPPAGAAGMS